MLNSPRVARHHMDKIIIFWCVLEHIVCDIFNWYQGAHYVKGTVLILTQKVMRNKYCILHKSILKFDVQDSGHIFVTTLWNQTTNETGLINKQTNMLIHKQLYPSRLFTHHNQIWASKCISISLQWKLHTKKILYIIQDVFS